MQTPEGAKKARETMKAKYGEDYFSRIGKSGGKKSKGGGFAYMKANGQEEKIKEAGRKGGERSRRVYDND